LLSDPFSASGHELLFQVLDGTPAGVGVLDTNLCYRFVNPALARMNGLPPAEHLGRTLAEVLPGIDAREDVLRAVLADGRSRETVSSGHTRADSPRQRRYWHGAYHRLESEGRTVGVVGIVLEVTTAREQQRALEQAQERLTLLDAAATLIGTTLDIDATCGELAGFLVPDLADVVTVEVLPEPGSTRPPAADTLRLRRAAVSAVEALRAGVSAFAVPGEFVDYQPGAANRRCLETGRPIMENLPSDEAMRRSAPNTSRVSQYRALGIHSALVVPLSARGRNVGTVTMARAGSSPVFTRDDAVAAVDLAGRAAINLDNARRYTAEHNAAVELQRALLAEPGRPHPGIEVAYRYLPAGRRTLVGGDWFEIVPLPGGRTLLAIGDVMGHGLDAAVAMSHYQAMLRVAAAQDLPPELILQQMDLLLRQAGVDRPATCLVVIADPARGHCVYANAGHLPPAAIDPDGHVALVPVPPGPPLATGLGSYRSVTGPCPQGRTLLLYTDGLVERRTEDIDVSLARLTDMRLSGAEDCEELLTRLVAEIAPTRPEDDIAIMAARTLTGSVSAAGPSRPGP
jgi:PAS domain S-box-containing protein